MEGPGNPYGEGGTGVGREAGVPGGVWELEIEGNFDCQGSNNQRKLVLLCNHIFPWCSMMAIYKNITGQTPSWGT